MAETSPYPWEENPDQWKENASADYEGVTKFNPFEILEVGARYYFDEPFAYGAFLVVEMNGDDPRFSPKQELVKDLNFKGGVYLGQASECEWFPLMRLSEYARNADSIGLFLGWPFKIREIESQYVFYVLYKSGHEYPKPRRAR